MTKQLEADALALVASLFLNDNPSVDVFSYPINSQSTLEEYNALYLINVITSPAFRGTINFNLGGRTVKQVNEAEICEISEGGNFIICDQVDLQGLDIDNSSPVLLEGFIYYK